ncbi:hypothetical protein [Mycobacterium riyadhense]|uniref:hypothetical protein n=1 Tax=Mycobacterium riyadhense TaxID=486698 RepID=UPI00146FB64F|nr:hypothetical protein [Mycobacterium riyadhense]MCV7145242.1 hypothetical protein [Mycobacterium riyadhense]
MLTKIIRVVREGLRGEAQVLAALRAANAFGSNAEIDDVDDGSRSGIPEGFRLDNPA